MKNICNSVLSIAPHISQALRAYQPVVALESTIISHGMPYPQNKQCALSIQNQITKHGAIPATIALIDGKIKIGLSQNQLQRLAFEGTKVKKVSRRDIPQTLMQKSLGATTVSSTMIGAQMAGINIFVTGGIGGVHRGYQHTLDASADLRQLGHTPVAVVSAGVKSILDISKTLEYLQTEGVPVITYKSQYFPAFFSESSGIKSPSSLNSTFDIAKVLFQKQKLGLRNGILVAVPNNNPAEGEVIEKAIKQALMQANQQDIKGAKITPFLLKRVNELSQGKSLASNISLVHNNAEIGSKIAVDLARLKEQSRKKYPLMREQLMGNGLEYCGGSILFRAKKDQGQCYAKEVQNKIQLKASNSYFQKKNDTDDYKKFSNHNNINSNLGYAKGKVIIIGASAVDQQYRPIKGEKFQLYKSCRGYSTRRIGGIGRNIAQVCARLSTPTTLITPLGDDQYTRLIKQSSSRLGIDLKQIYSPSYPTATYLTVMDEHNDEMLGISQMEINNQLNFDQVYNTYFNQQLKNNSLTPQTDIVIIDANFSNNPESLQDLEKLLGFLNEQGYFVIYECKGKKTVKIANPQLLKYISLLRMNKVEHDELFKVLSQKGIQIQPYNQDSYLSSIIGTQKSLINVIEQKNQVRSLITNKCSDIKLILKNKQTEMVAVKKSDKVIKTTGAGDTLTGSLVSMLLRGKTIQQGLRLAMTASRLSLETSNGQSVISDQISISKLQELLRSEI